MYSGVTMKKRLLSGLVGLLAAQPALSLDLVETYEKALSYDSGIATAQARFESQQASSDISQSALLPQIGAYGDAQHIDIDGPNQDNSYRELKDRKSTRLNSSHVRISYAVFCLKKKI